MTDKKTLILSYETATTSSDDAYRLIHSNLAGWLFGALEHGFESCPIKADPAIRYMKMASLMREIEGHTDIDTPLQQRQEV